MGPLETVLHYHDRTKHHFDRFAASLGYLDWATQPDPFRRFEGAPPFPLSLTPDDPQVAYDDLFTMGAVSSQPVSFQTISKFFELSLALSAWKQFGQSRWALRVNPSSGNLHPTEGYAILNSLDGLHGAPGVYHYAPREHALELRAELERPAWSQLMEAFPPQSFLIGLTSIHWREAWKYGERAFRYCQHDVGHAFAAVSLAAAVQGWTLHWLRDVSDHIVSTILGLNREADFENAEHESPDLLAVVIPSSPLDVESVVCNVSADAIQSMANQKWHGKANRLSATHVDWEIIAQVESAAIKTSDDLNAKESVPLSFPIALARSDARPSSNAATIIRQRRSAVDFDGKTYLEADQFYLILDRTLPRLDRLPWNSLGAPVCVDLALFVHRVHGLSPGLYYLVRDPARLDTLRKKTAADFDWSKPDDCPEHLPLYRLVSGDARELAAQLSCQQIIAGDSAFSCGMIAEFQSNLSKFGPWFYRRLFWETGVIGQILYLEAEAAGVRGTGIGCFFDDPVHETLGLRGHDFQSLYHFTIGGPEEDLRLMTWPPYSKRNED